MKIERELKRKGETTPWSEMCEFLEDVPFPTLNTF